MFDDVRDGTEFTEYNPDKGKWNTKLYKQKLQAISRVIREAVPGGPDVVLLQEVENLNVLNQLNGTYLLGFNYTYAVLVPAAGSATNVAVLSRHPLANVRIHNQHYHNAPLRNILEVILSFKGHTLYLFNNHWKSKIEGAAETEPARLEAARLINRRITALLQENPAADIIVAGDFNENTLEYTEAKQQYQTAFIPAGAVVPPEFRDKSLFLTNSAPDCGQQSGQVLLFEPWFTLPGAGSYAYRSKWQQFDHILTTCGLFDDQGFTYMSFQVIKKSYLLNQKSGLPLGWDNKKGGYSDHLPVLMSLKVAGE